MKRRHLLQGAAALAGASGFAAPVLAQPARTATLRFVPQANLTALDPIWTSAIVTQMHGYHSNKTSGNFFYDDEVLLSSGVEDLKVYNYDKDTPMKDLAQDLFI